MTYNIFTIGCQMNKADSERLSFYLENLGFSWCDDFLKSDLVVFVTCGVRQSAEDRAYGLVNRIFKNNKKSIIAITGCLSDRPDVKSRVGNKVKIFFNISSLINLNKKLEKHFPQLKINLKNKLKNYLDISAKRNSIFSAFVPIGNGCNNFCSYCVVPYARGREVYRSANEIIKEVESLIKSGYCEINLIAQNVNSYHSKINNEKIDFPDLLQKIDEISGNFWIRFSTSHPKDVSPKLIKVLKKSKKVCEHLHLAVQSGDDDILHKMNRKYSVEDYKNIVKKIRLALDNKNFLPASITTDIIVGFPGEKRNNFLNTIKLFKDVKFDLAYISKYSPRYGTISSQMDDDVTLNEKKRRDLELNNLLKKTALNNNKKYLNKEVEVLIEGFDRKKNLFGKTRTFKIVKIKNNFKKKSDLEKLIGKFIRVKIIKVFEFELQGELITTNNNKKKNKVVVILGPTASGKTTLAVKLAYKYKGEIISADSRQVYIGMDIGTGKDLAEYNYKNNKIPYHLIDVCSPKTVFSVAKYQKIALKTIDRVIENNHLPLLVGGSGLYLEVVIDNYNLSKVKPSFENRDEYEKMKLDELHKKIKKINSKFFKSINNSDLHNKRRLARYLELLLGEKDYMAQKKERRYDFLIIGLDPSRDDIKNKIYKRLIIRLENEGMIDEVEKLKKSGVSWKKLENFGLEYRFIARYLQKKISYQQLIDNLFIAICKFSKRQMSWFRRFERQGGKIFWISKESEAQKLINNFLK